jgi:putative hydrolase of the HAD superfamily
MTERRFDALLFDAGGVFIIPDPIAIGAAIEPWIGHLPVGRFHRAHYVGLHALEMAAFAHETRTIETLNWRTYREAYLGELGIASPSDIEASLDALGRIWSAPLWRYRIEESMAALWRLHLKQVPMGVVSNASGQVEGTLRHEGICQVGAGGGIPMLCVVDSHVVGVQKPDPRIFAPALAALGNPDPSRVAYIGDSAINDVEGARAAGLVPLHLDPYDLYAAMDHERINSLHDLHIWFE